MTNKLSDKLNQFHISGKLSDDPASRKKTLFTIAVPPIILLVFFLFFALYTGFYELAYFNLGIISIISIALFFIYAEKFAIGKTILITSLILTTFIYFKQFDPDYYIFCYFFPLTLGVFMFFDFLKEQASFYATLIFAGLCCIVTILLPPHLFGQFNIPEVVKPISQLLNILFSVVLCILYMVMLIHITVRKETELIDAKEAAEAASRAKATFLSSMSHELRTPLNGITGTAHILQYEQDDAERKKHLETLRYLSEHMTRLVNDILDYSKIESGKMQLNNTRFKITDLLTKLEVTSRTAIEDNMLMVSVEIDEKLRNTTIVSDEMRIMQVMTNLLSNAIKFTEKGSIKIYANCMADHTDSLTLRMGIKDTGIGIRKEHINKIFESFSQADSDTTRKYGGTGLGLSISVNIINMLHGKLYVDTEYGKGSDFYFMINVPVAALKERIKEKETISFEKIKHLKVLLAEDNPVNMIVAKKLLQKWDVQITEAVNGLIAVEKFRNADFDLVLMDLEMPEMDGRNAAKIIQKEKPGIPIIAFTAAFYENMETDLQMQGFSGYIPKPFKPEDLYHKISAIV